MYLRTSGANPFPSPIAFTQGNPTQVHITVGEVADGPYDIVLESYDNNSGPKATMHSQKITINVMYRFIRSTPPPTTVELNYMESKTISIDNLRSETAAVSLSIVVTSSLGNQYTTVTNSSPTIVQFLPNELVAGTHLCELKTYHQGLTQ